MKYLSYITVSVIKELVRQCNLVFFNILDKSAQSPGFSGCYALEQFAKDTNYNQDVIMFRQALNNIYLVAQEGLDVIKLKTMFNLVEVELGRI